MAQYLPGPPYPLGQIDYPRPGHFLVAGDARAAINFRAPKGKALALVAYPYDVTIPRSVYGPPFPLGTPAWPAASSITIPGATRTITAATHWALSVPIRSRWTSARRRIPRAPCGAFVRCVATSFSLTRAP